MKEKKLVSSWWHLLPTVISASYIFICIFWVNIRCFKKIQTIVYLFRQTDRYQIENIFAATETSSYDYIIWLIIIITTNYYFALLFMVLFVGQSFSDDDLVNVITVWYHVYGWNCGRSGFQVSLAKRKARINYLVFVCKLVENAK